MVEKRSKRQTIRKYKGACSNIHEAIVDEWGQREYFVKIRDGKGKEIKTAREGQVAFFFFKKKKKNEEQEGK